MISFFIGPNNLLDIPAFYFEPFTNLKQLKMEDCGIEHFHDDVFHGLDSLTKLYMRNVSYLNLTGRTPALELLQISLYTSPFIPNENVHDLSALKTVTLWQENNLETLPRFIGAASLTDLNGVFVAKEKKERKFKMHGKDGKMKKHPLFQTMKINRSIGHT